MAQIAKANFWHLDEKFMSPTFSTIINTHEKYLGFWYFKHMTWCQLQTLMPKRQYTLHSLCPPWIKNYCSTPVPHFCRGTGWNCWRYSRSGKKNFLSPTTFYAIHTKHRNQRNFYQTGGASSSSHLISSSATFKETVQWHMYGERDCYLQPEQWSELTQYIKDSLCQQRLLIYWKQD